MVDFGAAIADAFKTLGDLADFTPATGDAVTGIYVMLELSTSVMPGGYDSGIPETMKTIEYQLADIDREVLKDETFEIDDTTYTWCYVVNNDGYTVTGAVK